MIGSNNDVALDDSRFVTPGQPNRGGGTRILASNRRKYLVTQVEQPTHPTTNGTSATPDRLQNDKGKITVAESVVQKIAGIACREISGVYAMGSSTGRTFGAIRESIPGSMGAPNIAQGVRVQVGDTQAAIDLDIVVEYGVAIADLADSIQRNVKQAVEQMAGLEVVEVNVNVDDVHLPHEEDDHAIPPPSRVS